MRKYLIIIYIILILHLNTKCFAFMEDQLDINMASVTELMLLDGIDRHIATLIVEKRNTNGEFKTIEEIIPIVTPEIFERIKFDIIAKPIKDRYKNAINGRIVAERGESLNNESQPHPYWNIYSNFNILDQINGYIRYNNFELYYGRIKKKTYFERSIGINIFKRENIIDVKTMLTSPEPKVFKRIDLEKVKQEKDKRIKNYFEKAFSEKILTGNTKNKKVQGYFGSSSNYVDYLSKQYSKNVVEKNKVTVPKYKERKYGQPIKIDFTKSKKIISSKKSSTKKPGKKIRKKLTTKILLGDVTVPYKKRPLVSADGQGIKVVNIHNFWENSFFYFTDSSQDEQYAAGGSLSFDMKDKTTLSTSLYQVRDASTGNNFNNFLISAKKKKYKTEFYIQYDNLLGLAHGLYGKISSSIKNFKYSLSLNFTEADYKNFNDIVPYQSYYTYISDVMESNLNLTWYFLKNSSVTIETFSSVQNLDKYSSSTYQDSYSKGSGTNIYLNYKPNSKLTTKMTIGKGESYKGDNSKTDIELSYKLTKKIKTGFKHSISNKKNAYEKYDYNKLYLSNDFSKDLNWSSYFTQTLTPGNTRELNQKITWKMLGNFKVKFNHTLTLKETSTRHELMLTFENKF